MTVALYGCVIDRITEHLRIERRFCGAAPHQPYQPADDRAERRTSGRNDEFDNCGNSFMSKAGAFSDARAT